MVASDSLLYTIEDATINRSAVLVEGRNSRHMKSGPTTGLFDTFIPGATFWRDRGHLAVEVNMTREQKEIRRLPRHSEKGWGSKQVELVGGSNKHQA